VAIGTIGKYERLDVLGHGSSGVVYLAWDTLLRRNVALKEIRADGPEMDRVLDEARVLDRLSHPNIVHINGVDVVNGVILIDMELVRGGNLSDRLRARAGEPLPAEEAVRITLAVLDALGYAHERRIIHRDIKPANILLTEAGDVKLTDFGLAEALGTGSVAGGGGTYPYMAPEDFAEDDASDYRSDLWAVGVVLYEMLAGRRPFSVPRVKDPFAWKRAIEQEEPPRLTALRPELSSAFDEVIARALAKDKARRFPTARVFADALRAVPLGAVATPRSEGTSAAAPPPLQRADEEEGEPEPFVFPTGTVCYTLDDLLPAAARHWNEARRALLDGRTERFLRGIGEVYIADLAAELAARGRNGENEDRLLREFLDRSRPEDDADALATLPVAARPGRPLFGGGSDGTEGSTGSGQRRRLRMRRVPRPARDAAPDEAPLLPGGGREPLVFATAPAAAPAAPPLPGAAVADPPRRDREDRRRARELRKQEAREARLEAQVRARHERDLRQQPPEDRDADSARTGGVRWWFWPALALCVAPPAAMLASMSASGLHIGSEVWVRNALTSWTVTGFLAAMLLIVCLGLNLASIARFLAFVPMAAGLVAAGALASSTLEPYPTVDGVVRVGVGLLVPIVFLLFQAGTARRLWRLWLALLFLGAGGITFLCLAPMLR